MARTTTSMRRITLLLLALLSHLLVSVTAQLSGGIIRRRGTQFIDQTEKPFLVHGCNLYYLMYQGAGHSTRKSVDNVFDDAQKLGLNVARTWAFYDGPVDRALQRAPGVYDETVFKALDYAIYQARKHNMRLVLSLVNNYKDYGGKPQYVTWARQYGIEVRNDDAFFTHPTIRTWYKNHVKKVLTRVNTITGVAYKDDPTIFSWELMNEPHCKSDVTGDTLAAWVKEMAAYAKSVDSKHMVEIGLEGFYGASTGASRRWANPFNSDGAGTDFLRLNKIANVDYATVHSYPDLWIPKSTNSAKLTFLQIWVNLHIKDASTILNKPVVFCEFGKNKRAAGYKPEMRQQFFWTVYNSVLSSMKKGGSGAGSMLWQLLPKGMESWDDGFAVFAHERSTSNIISIQAQRLAQTRKDLMARRSRRLLL